MHRGLRESLTELTQEQVDRIKRGAWYHSIELPDGRVVPGVIPVEALRARFDSFGIPMDLRGKRVLDVGAATGWCSFELERRGAAVVAVDCVEYEDFRVAHRLLGSGVDYRMLDMEEMTPERLGVFDYVLFFGVLYHLRHPLLGLERVCSLTRDTAYIESFISDAHLSQAERAAGPVTIEFYETNELGGQIDNWVGPTQNCLLSLCRSAGFVRVEWKYVADSRAGVVCRRRWEELPEPVGGAPWLNSAVNNRTGDSSFHPHKDEYISLYFDTAETDLNRDDLFIEIDGFAASPLIVASIGQQGWQANMRVPPGLATGRHSVRLRTANSAFSNSTEIEMRDEGDTSGRPIRPPVFPPPATNERPDLFRVENGTTGTPDFRGFRSETLCCHFHSPGARLNRDELLIEVGNCALPVLFLTERRNGWQANCKLPPDLSPGTHPVRLRTRTSDWSGQLDIRIVS